MTREEKIQEILDNYPEKFNPGGGMWRELHLKAGILAGIALRDAELLASVGEWSLAKFKENFSVDGERYALGQRFTYTDAQLELIYKGSKAQHEQFIKAIKGDG